MNIIQEREKFFIPLLEQLQSWRNGLASRLDIQRFINLDKQTADLLQTFSYDPYYSYRKYIENQDDYNRSLCFIWWYLEGYYLGKGDIDKGQDYTFKLCRKLKLNSSMVCDKIFEQLEIN